MTFNFDSRIITAARQAEENCAEAFSRIEKNAALNSERVLGAFINNRAGTPCLTGTTGYGYGDAGRDVLDRIYADVFQTEDALVRHNFVSGTHALSCALFGLLRTGDTLVSLIGAPYDTLKKVISGNGGGSLSDYGIKYRQVELLEDGRPDIEKIAVMSEGAKVGFIQRSRGYSLRPALTVSDIEKIIKAAKKANPDIIILTDNCYGEFTEDREPTAAGSDICVGSLIKNPGGGIAETGGYIAGKSELIELCANRLTSVGTGREAGATLNQNKFMYQGLFYAPVAVENAMKTAVFAGELLRIFGFDCKPALNEEKSDIITAAVMRTPERLIAFCQGIQKGSPIDSFAAPEPWDMPGYGSKIIMAAGTFNMGASIELSADAPLREPFAVYIQGGVNYYAAKTGILTAVQELMTRNLL